MNTYSSIRRRSWVLVSSATIRTPRAILLLAGIALCRLSFAQQPQTVDIGATQPIYAANAKYVQGVGPGYWPTAGTGLALNLTGGTAMCGAPPVLVTYSGGFLTMVLSQTNYVYLDPSLGCAPSSNITGFIPGQIPLATVVTSTVAITSITDARNWFVPQPVGTDSTGKAVTKYLNGFRFADQFTRPNMVASAIADAGSNGSTIINPSANSTSTEFVCGAGMAINAIQGPGTPNNNGCANTSNIQIWDFRNGFSATGYDPTGNLQNGGGNYRPWWLMVANYSRPSAPH